MYIRFFTLECWQVAMGRKEPKATVEELKSFKDLGDNVAKYVRNTMQNAVALRLPQVESIRRSKFKVVLRRTPEFLLYDIMGSLEFFLQHPPSSSPSSTFQCRNLP